MAMYVYVNRHELSAVAELPDHTPNRLAVIGRFWEYEHAFSATHEYAYRVTNPPTFNWMQVLGARLGYNPSEPVKGNWVEVGPYDKDKLTEYVRAAVTLDDDIIQQWFDGDEVMKLIASENSFDDVLLAVDAICGRHESNADTLAYVERIVGKRPD
jgi:hypothetical protein